MTRRDLDRKAAVQGRTLDVWLKEARRLVDDKVADARAHAITAVTDTLKRTPDGRKTLRKASQSRSYKAAENRLAELWAALCGPSTASLKGLVRDARAAFYVDAVSLWGSFIPEEFRDDPIDMISGLRAARGMVLHGTELRKEIGAPIERARRTLLAAVAVAGSRSTPVRASTEVLVTWARKSSDAIFAATRLALSDSLGAADAMALYDLVKPEFRSETVAVPGGA